MLKRVVFCIIASVCHPVPPVRKGTQRDVSPRPLGGAHHQESKHLPAYLSWDAKQPGKIMLQIKSYDQNSAKLEIQKLYHPSAQKYNDAVHNISLLFEFQHWAKKNTLIHGGVMPPNEYHRATCWNHVDDRTNKENISRSCSDFDDRTYFNIACMQIHHHPLLKTMSYISVILCSGPHDRALQRTSAYYYAIRLATPRPLHITT